MRGDAVVGVERLAGLNRGDVQRFAGTAGSTQERRNGDDHDTPRHRSHLQYDFANQACTVAAPPHLMHRLPVAGRLSNGTLRMVACVSVLTAASHSADPHHGDTTKPGRPSMISLNSS